MLRARGLAEADVIGGALLAALATLVACAAGAEGTGSDDDPIDAARIDAEQRAAQVWRALADSEGGDVD